MSNSNPQKEKFALVVGATGYRTRSDVTATPGTYLTAPSQNMLINEATDKEGDKVESRPGYTQKGAPSEDRDGAKNETVFKTKTGDSIMLKFSSDGVLRFFSDTIDDWEVLMDFLDGDHYCRFTTVYNSTELLRELLFVNHTSSIFEWSGARGTLASIVDATHIQLNETIGSQGFLSMGTRKIRIKDSSGVWHEATVTNQATNVFEVSDDLTAFVFDANAPVVQSVRENATTPAAGFVNDVIRSLENHVYVGSHASPVVYMSKSTNFADFAFSNPRLATEGWQFVLDDYMVGFETNLTGTGEESMVFFAGSDWIYRVKFVDSTDSTISQLAQVKAITVSSGQGAISQELIAKIKNSIVYINAFNELLELGNVENVTIPTLTPLSDPIKPDFLAATFIGGCIKLWRNNVYITAVGITFILAFRESDSGTKRFWQPPQLLPVGPLSDYKGHLIGHSQAINESYTLFDGSNDNGKPIAFKAYWPYNNSGAREKLKNFDKYFVELYLTSNTQVRLNILYEYFGAKTIKTYPFNGTESNFIFTPNDSASLGVNALGTSPLGATQSAPIDFLKYRRFKKVSPVPDHYEYQVGFECDGDDNQFQILCHGSNSVLSTNAPANQID